MKRFILAAFLASGSFHGSVFCLKEPGHRVMHCYTATEELVMHLTPGGRIKCEESWSFDATGIRATLDTETCPTKPNIIRNNKVN
jgi:hypothetical protein